MAKIRIGFGTELNIGSELSGIGTDNPTNTKQVVDNIHATNAKAIGISTFTTYQGFLDKKATFGKSVIDINSQAGALSGDIVIDGEVTVSSGSSLCSSVDELTLTDSFSLPTGDTDSRIHCKTAGSMRFNEDLGTLEFYTGDMWRTVNFTSSAGRAVLFGGNHNQTSVGAKTRWIELMPVDTSNAEYFSIKAARGNGVNGGDASEESLKVYYSTAGSPTTWILVDTIIAGRTTSRNDPFIGTVPAVDLNNTWDGASGDTKWYTYTVSLPQNAKASGTNFKIEQTRADASSTNDNAGNTDHFAICEFIWWNGKATTLVYVPTAGKILKQNVDSLTYTVQGEVGPSVTYSSGLGCSDATLTLKATTKIEPQATIDPDIDVPLIHPYRTCKYLIKAY